MNAPKVKINYPNKTRQPAQMLGRALYLGTYEQFGKDLLQDNDFDDDFIDEPDASNSFGVSIIRHDDPTEEEQKEAEDKFKE